MSTIKTTRSSGKFRFPLDFALKTSEERKAYVDKIIDEQLSYPYAQNQLNLLNLFTQKELDTFSNYILYGKDESTQLTSSKGEKVGGTSAIDRGEIVINPKHSTYSRKPIESLNSLMESPTFNENELSPIRAKANKFTTPKVNFSRKEAYNIPGLAEELEPLWDEIDRIDRLLILNSGNQEKIERVRAQLILELGETEATNYLARLKSKLPLDSLSLYKYKHLLVDLRKQQYTIKDCFAPATQMQAQKTTYCADDDLGLLTAWDSKDYSISPLGPYRDGDLKFTNPTLLPISIPQFKLDKTLLTIDFTNPDHVHTLLNSFIELESEVDSNPLSSARDLVDTLNFYRGLADLSPSYSYILDLKIQKLTNTQIAKLVNEKFGLSHTENYISTIYCKKICTEISEAAQLNYDGYMNRFDPFKWKTCSSCGVKKLRDTRVFTRKSRSSDGLANKCKLCEKKERHSKK